MADALEAHEEALEYGGGALGILSLDGLEGALGRPYHGHHRLIHLKAAALLHGVVSSHAFIDGNKRTALLLTYLLIDRSDYELVLREDEYFDDMVVNVVEGNISQGELAAWFRLRISRP